MPVTFDGVNKIIQCTTGTTSIDMVDVYSRWKEWVSEDSNSKFLQAFRAVGGDPISQINSITPYFFLLNGWKIKPQAATHVLTVNGIVITEDDSNPFVGCEELPGCDVMIKQIVPVKAESINVGAYQTAPEDIANAIMDLSYIENGLTFRQALMLMAAALAGKISGADTTTVTIRNALADDKDRIIATVDENGNRTGITIDVSS